MASKVFVEKVAEEYFKKHLRLSHGFDIKTLESYEAFIKVIGKAIDEAKKPLLKALSDIRRIDVADCEKYVQKADSIACEALAKDE